MRCGAPSDGAGHWALKLLGVAAALVASVAGPRGAAAEPLPNVALSSEATASMSTARHVHAAISLLDGRVLAVGGFDEGATTAEIFDPATGTWSLTAPPLYPHTWAVATRLCDGRVYVGGQFSIDVRNAEIYDPATDTWAPAGIMKYAHIYGTALLLADCRVLLVGGYNANTRAETFDPATGVYKPTNAMSSERFFHTTTLLADGRVLVAAGGVDVNIGGVQQWQTYGTADIFDPATNKWSPVAPLKRKRRSHTATLLPDGRVLVTGGSTGGKANGTDGGTQLATAEIYDVAANTWELLPAQLVTPRSFHTFAVMPNGAITFFGGLDESGSASRQVEAYYQGVFQPLEPLLADRLQHASAQLPDGGVLLTGGVHQATAEIYRFAAPGDPCDSALACATGFCVGGLCCNEACDTGCRRCDLPGTEGTCSRSCADAENTLACPDGSTTCPNDTCVPEPCSPLRCDSATAACLATCTSVEDCAPGYACDPEGQCVPPPDVSSTDAEACAARGGPPTSASGSGAPGGAVVAVGALAALAVARRRRGARRDGDCSEAGKKTK